VATETLRADAVVANNACLTPANAQGAPDGTWTTNAGNSTWDCRWSLGNPANELTSGFTTHNAIARVRRSASGGNNPTATLQLWSNGSLVRQLASVALTSDTGQDIGGDFTTAEAGPGANLELRVSGTPAGGSGSTKRTVQVDGFTVVVDTAAAATNLVIADAVHAHTVDNLVLTQVYNLTVQEASHAHTTDNLVLTQVHNLTIANALHAHSADNLVISEGGDADLIIADGAHAHTADNLTLTVEYNLVVQDGLHTHSVDNLVLAQVHSLVVQGATHVHIVDSITLTFGELPVGHVYTEAHQIALGRLGDINAVLNGIQYEFENLGSTPEEATVNKLGRDRNRAEETRSQIQGLLREYELEGN
jgi:hypothetical protein